VSQAGNHGLSPCSRKGRQPAGRNRRAEEGKEKWRGDDETLPGLGSFTPALRRGAASGAPCSWTYEGL